MDCAASCPAPLPPAPPSDGFIIGGLDGTVVVMLIVFILGSAVFVGLITMCPNLCAYTGESQIFF